MNPPRYRYNARTEAFLKLWFSFGLMTITNGKLTTDWNQIDWGTVEVQVFKLQKRIYRASQSGDVAKVHKLQRLLLRSWNARLLAVRRISQDNQGKHTAGIDGYKSLTPKQRLTLAENLTLNEKGSPLRRVWIPKPGRTEKRGLGIPIMEDRARQSLLKLALEPEWEAKFEPNSYGFRPGRACHDAVVAIQTAINKKPKYVLDADIAKCFDRINHKVLLQKMNTTPAIARQVRAWLKSGMLDKGDWFPTEEGTPQGGVISPLLANIALHGIEEYINQWVDTLKMEGLRGKHKRQSIAIIRYADDLVILHKDKSVIQQTKELISNWLNGIGLELKENKTRICHTLNVVDDEEPGFNFLGWNVRQHKIGKHHSGKLDSGKKLGFKTIIKPSKKSVKTHYRKIAKTLDVMSGKSQEEVIARLNSIIKGWTNYHSAVCSKETFKKLDQMVYNKLRRWVKRRHPNKTLNWCKQKYFHRTKEKTAQGLERTDQWVFSVPSSESNNPVAGTHELRKHAWTPIVYHTKVKGNKSPFDGDWRYWSSRRGEYPGTPTRVAKLLKRQKGKCTRCGLYFEDEDVLEVDHIVPKAEGGKDQYKNYQLLHRHCHHEKTAEDTKRQRENKQGSANKVSVR